MNTISAEKIKKVLSSLPSYISKEGSARLLNYNNHYDINQVQSTLNALVSLYDHTLVYNYLKNESIFVNLKPLINTPENNLVVNVRLHSESGARYVFGYNQASETGYSLFSEINPSIKNPSEADHLFVSEVFYRDYIFLDELRNLCEYEGLLALPLLLKQWDNIRDYFTDNIHEFKEIVIKNLENLKCPRYASLISSLEESGYSAPTIEVLEMTRNEAYWLLLATMFKRYFKISDNLNDEQIGFLLYKCVGEEDLSSLNVKFPAKKPYIPIVNTRINRIQLGDQELVIVKDFEERYESKTVPNHSINEEMKKFFDIIAIKGFTDTKGFKDKFTRLVNSLDNTEFVNINGTNVPSFFSSTSTYKIYISILEELLLNMRNDNNITDIEYKKLEAIAYAVLKCVYNFNKNNKPLISSEYNVLFNKVKKGTTNVSIYVSIHKVIADLLNHINTLSGGATNQICYAYSSSFNFFNHAYLIDAFVSHKKIRGPDPKYKNNTFESNDIELFWNGISYADYEKLDLETKYLYSNIYDTFFLEDNCNETIFKTTGENATRVVFAASLFAENLSTADLLKTLTERVLNDLKTEQCPINITHKIDSKFGNNVIRSVDKLKVVDTPEKLPAFIQAVLETQKNNLQPATMLEVLVFLFGLLEKLGFDVKKTYSKTNMTISIEPAPIKENISKKVGDKAFVENYGNWIEDIFNGGSTLVIALPREEKHINITNLEQYIGGNFTIDEEEDLLKSLQILIDTDNVTIDNLHRLIPYYIKEQIHMISEAEKGGSSVIGDNFISMFLRKVKNIDTKPVVEDTEKAIDRFLQEKYINSLNRLVPFYDSKINFINTQDKSSHLLRHTLETIKFMRNNMQIDLSKSIKKGLYNIFILKQRSDEFCYKSFILIQYIKHMIDELQNRLKIQPVPTVIGFTDFSSFYKIISSRLEEHERRYKDDVIAKSVEFFNQRVGSNIEAKELDEESFMKLFDTVNNTVTIN